MKQALLAALAAMALLAVACGSDSDSDTTTAEEALADHYDAFNDYDIDATMATFADDGVMVNHPARAESGEISGNVMRQQTMTMIGFAEPGGGFELCDIEPTGDHAVTYSYTFTNSEGEQFVNSDVTVTVKEDGLISEMAWLEGSAGATSGGCE